MTAPRRLYVAEPPRAFRARRPVVADCSVLGALFFQEPERDSAQRLLEGCDVHAPTLLDHEFANVAVKKRQRGAPTATVEAALQAYADQPLELHRVDLAAQCELAHRYALSAYDAAYLWLADALKAPLLTFDQRLAEAARTHFGGSD